VEGVVGVAVAGRLFYAGDYSDELSKEMLDESGVLLIKVD